MRAADFHIGAKNSNRCPVHIARHIAGVAFTFHTTEKTNHFFKFTSGITTNMKWMVVDRPEALRSWAVRSPLSSSKLAQFIPGNFSSQMVHVMAVHKLLQKNNTCNVWFGFHLNGDACSLIYISLFHTLNAICTLPSNIIEMDKYNEYENAAIAVSRKRIDPQSNAVKIAYTRSRILRNVHARQCLDRSFRLNC